MGQVGEGVDLLLNRSLLKEAATACNWETGHPGQLHVSVPVTVTVAVSIAVTVPVPGPLITVSVPVTPARGKCMRLKVN